MKGSKYLIWIFFLKYTIEETDKAESTLKLNYRYGDKNCIYGTRDECFFSCVYTARHYKCAGHHRLQRFWNCSISDDVQLF